MRLRLPASPSPEAPVDGSAGRHSFFPPTPPARANASALHPTLTMPTTTPKPIGGRAHWTGPDLLKNPNWGLELSADELAELDSGKWRSCVRALQHAAAAGGMEVVAS